MSPRPAKTMSTVAGRPLSFTCNSIDNRQQNHSQKTTCTIPMAHRNRICCLPEISRYIHSSRSFDTDIPNIWLLKLIAMVSCVRWTDLLHLMKFLSLPVSYSSAYAYDELTSSFDLSSVNLTVQVFGMR